MLQQSNHTDELSNLKLDEIQHHQSSQPQDRTLLEGEISSPLNNQTKNIENIESENLTSVQQQTIQPKIIKSDQFDLVQKNQKPSTNYKDLLAQRPTNVQQSFQNQKTSPIPVETNTHLQKSSTTTNFHVSKKNSNKSRSSQKVLLSKKSQPFQIQQKEQHFKNLNKQSDSISDITVLILLHKVVERMRTRGDDLTMECLVNEEKLIHISIAFLEKKIVQKQEVDRYYSLEKEIVAFVQKINKVTMENFKEEDENIDVKIFSKAVDLLMTPNLNRFVKDLKTLGKIKVLTFNNLACIYKKKRKFGIALRSVSFALQIQEALLNEQSNQEKYDIVPTYLNKAAILSQMNKHQKAIQQIMKSQKFIQKIQRQVIKQITQAQNNSNTELKKRLQQKRYYGLYMKMIINYNMGAEKEHMKMIQSACEYYKQGRQLALMINNQLMVKKFQNILNKLMDLKRK